MHPTLDTPSLCAPILCTNQRHALACIVLFSVTRPVSLIWIWPAQCQIRIFFLTLIINFFLSSLVLCLVAFPAAYPPLGDTLPSGQPESNGLRHRLLGSSALQKFVSHGIYSLLPLQLRLSKGIWSILY